MNKIKSIVACLIILLGCSSDNLSREKAEKLITENLNLPHAEVKNFELNDNSFVMSRTEEEFKQLQNEGVLTYIHTPPQSGCLGCESVRATLTEEGSQYLGGKAGSNTVPVITSHIAFGSITGIVEQKGVNTAKVDYTLIRTNVTPFGRIAFRLNEETFSRTATFTKYDDDWRIER